MARQDLLDCIVVGYNDLEFSTFAEAQKKRARFSGAYHEIKTNSVIVEGKRITYTELINQVMARSTGQNPNLNVFELPSLGVCYLVNFLRKKELEVEIVNFFNFDKQKFRDFLATKPRSVAITTTYYVDNAPIVEIVKFVREHSPETRVIVGGPHIFNMSADLDTMTQEVMFKMIGADIFITDSQGEGTLAEVVRRLRDGESLDAVPNLILAEGGGFTRTAREIESNDLDENTIDWSMFDKDFVSPVAYMRTARSCPFACSFCNYPTMAGKHVLAGVDHVECQLNQLHAMGTRFLIFIDDTFNVPLPRFKKLLRMMIRNQYQFQWISFLRCSNVDEETIDLMAESGCIGVLLGIESGDQTILNYMNKAAKLDRYRWGIKELNQRGIATFASLICGFPGETTESFANSMAFVEETQPTFFNFQLYYHDTRAPIARRSEEFAIKGAGYSWQHRNMDWKQAADMATNAFRSVSQSTPLSLYGFSLWVFPYLASKGIPVPKVKRFGEITRDLLVSSLEDQPTDWTPQRRQLNELFRGVQPISG